MCRAMHASRHQQQGPRDGLHSLDRQAPHLQVSANSLNWEFLQSVCKSSWGCCLHVPDKQAEAFDAGQHIAQQTHSAQRKPCTLCVQLAAVQCSLCCTQPRPSSLTGVLASMRGVCTCALVFGGR